MPLTWRPYDAPEPQIINVPADGVRRQQPGRGAGRYRGRRGDPGRGRRVLVQVPDSRGGSRPGHRSPATRTTPHSGPCGARGPEQADRAPRHPRCGAGGPSPTGIRPPGTGRAAGEARGLTRHLVRARGRRAALARYGAGDAGRADGVEVPHLRPVARRKARHILVRAGRRAAGREPRQTDREQHTGDRHRCLLGVSAMRRSWSEPECVGCWFSRVGHKPTSAPTSPGQAGRPANQARRTLPRPGRVAMRDRPEGPGRRGSGRAKPLSSRRPKSLSHSG
jgi:hypothetical protein